MINGISDKDVLEYLAPTDGVVSGQLVRIDSIALVAAADAAESEPFEGVTKGIFWLPRVDDETWTEGLKLYFDEGAGLVTLDDNSAANPLIGVAVDAILDSAAQATGRVRLDGAAR